MNLLDELLAGLAAGLATGLLAVVGRRHPGAGWICFTPLTWVVLTSAPAAAVAGAIAGGLSSAPAVSSKPMRSLLAITVVPSALLWSLGVTGCAWVCSAVGEAAMALALPTTAVLVHLPLRWVGAPRWVSNPIACTQERWLAVLQLARVGGDLVITALLAVTGAALALLPREPWVSGALLLAALTSVSWGAARYLMQKRPLDEADTLEIAAVVVDGHPPPSGEPGGLWPIESQQYRDVEGTLTRYHPHVQAACERGAKLVVLPEVCVSVDETTRERWFEGVRSWAERWQVTFVAPYFDLSEPRNRLVVIAPEGVVGRYEKQHPGRGLEPPRLERMPPGPYPLTAAERPIWLSTVLCVDLDYSDLVAPVRRSGGILAVPANDWFGGFEELHHSTAVWSAVMTGVPLVRSTGQGISAVFDGSGRVLAQASSRRGPVVLVVDVPVSSR